MMAVIIFILKQVQVALILLEIQILLLMILVFLRMDKYLLLIINMELIKEHYRLKNLMEVLGLLYDQVQAIKEILDIQKPLSL